MVNPRCHFLGARSMKELKRHGSRSSHAPDLTVIEVPFGRAIHLVTETRRMALPCDETCYAVVRACGYDPDSRPAFPISVYQVGIPEIVRLGLEIAPEDGDGLTATHFLVIDRWGRGAYIVGPSRYQPLGTALVQRYLSETASG